VETKNLNPQIQNNQQMGQQNRMPEPPQIVTSKDYSYLTDALSWELDIIKKFNHFAQETQDSKTKNLIKRAAQIHQKHYSILLKHLNPANSAAKINQ
jgi:hypothetical protein